MKKHEKFAATANPGTGFLQALNAATQPLLLGGGLH